MKNLKYIFITIFYIPIYYSCTETLDIDTKDVKPKIVLNGFIEADSAITVRISKTYPFTNDYYENQGRGSSKSTDTIVPNFLPQAKPIIYINDVLQGDMIFQKNDTSFSSNGSVFHSEVRPKVGDKVRIEVSAQGFETVWAETVIPQPIQIHQVDTNTFITTNKYVDGLNNMKRQITSHLFKGEHVDSLDWIIASVLAAYDGIFLRNRGIL